MTLCLFYESLYSFFREKELNEKKINEKENK